MREIRLFLQKYGYSYVYTSFQQVNSRGVENSVDKIFECRKLLSFALGKYRDFSVVKTREINVSSETLCVSCRDIGTIVRGFRY